MKRLLFHAALALCTLLLMAVVADWIHSIFYSETLILVRGRTVYAIDNFNGEFAFWRGDFKPTESFPDGWYHEHWGRFDAKQTLEFSVDDSMAGELAFAGFAITGQRHFPTTISQSFNPGVIKSHVAVVMPSWFLTLLFGVLPGLTAWRFIRGLRRRGEGLCPTCGYDLRATRDRCPECGTPITVPALAESPRTVS